jgi:nicotinamide-nucleotide adenylyltransferase
VVVEIDELVVGIGSADKSHTFDDPFTAGERIMMITKSLKQFGMPTYTVPIEDLNRNAVWISHAQSMSPRFDVAYSNNPLVLLPYERCVNISVTIALVVAAVAPVLLTMYIARMRRVTI